MSLVQGRNVLLKVLKNGTYSSIACNTNCTLETTVGSLRTTFRGAGASEGYLPTTVSKVLTGNGPIYLDDTLTADDIQSYTDTRQIIAWEFELTDNDANVVTYSGNGFFTSLRLQGDVSQPADCAYTIQVTGAVSIGVGPGTGTGAGPFVFLYDATGGESSIADADLIGATVVDVERNGIGLVVTTISPANGNEVQFTTGTGTLTFGTVLGAGEYIQVLYTT